MNPNQAKRIEEIIRNQDVRDPRLTPDAIAAILSEKGEADEIPHLVPDDVKNEFGDPVAVIRIYNTKPVPGTLNVGVAMEYCDTHIEPRHFVAVEGAIQEFADKKVAEQ